MSLDVLRDRPANPHAGVKVFADYRGPVRDKCDVLVVGSGPGGAVVAKELAERGKDVVLLEEGPPYGAKDMRPEASQVMQRTLREAGTRTTRGNFYMPTMQAIALGGNSLINSAISCRAPDWSLDKWAERHGLTDLRAGSLDEHYEAVEKFLGIADTPSDVLGERNLLFKRGCDALGWASAPTPRNAPGCKGSAECFSGCRNGAKQSTDVSYVPAAIRAGARVYTSVRAEHLVGDARRVRAMRGRTIEPFTWREGDEVEIEAKHVVLAAGCVQTPVIMLRSGIGNASGQVGENLRAHPGLAVMGIYDHAVDPWKGATQGYHSLHFLEEGMKLEVLWAPPGILAVRFPGFGAEFKDFLLQFDRMAPFDVFIDAKHSTGRVKPRTRGWDPEIRYDMDDRDVALLQLGVVRLVELCWAAGAVAVLPGIHGVPDVLRSPDDTRYLREYVMQAKDGTIGGTHIFGTTRMGRDAKSSVTDSFGKCHEVDNLWVSDTGIFPDSPAVNPMLTCMALARRVAHRLADAS
jgi:choline dehydrogenase-like flavoprotein